MPSSFATLTIHAVFGVKYRACLLTNPHRDRIHAYISGILKDTTDRALAVGGWLDHVHVAFALKRTRSVAKVMELVKANASRWINQEGLFDQEFHWQDGYAAFSVSHTHRPQLFHYIANQEAHHRGERFLDEYRRLLMLHEEDFEERDLPRELL